MASKRAPKLKPCPFCGGRSAFAERGTICSYYIMCNDCGARGPFVEELDYEAHEGHPERDAAREWNKRRRAQPVEPHHDA